MNQKYNMNATKYLVVISLRAVDFRILNILFAIRFVGEARRCLKDLCADQKFHKDESQFADRNFGHVH